MKQLELLMRFLENEALVKHRPFNAGEWTLNMTSAPIKLWYGLRHVCMRDGRAVILRWITGSGIPG